MFTNFATYCVISYLLQMSKAYDLLISSLELKTFFSNFKITIKFKKLETF